MTLRNLVFCVCILFYCSCEIEKNKKNVYLNDFKNANIQSNGENFLLDSIFVNYPEETNFIGSLNNNLVFRTTSDSIILSDSEGFITHKIGVTGDDATKIGSKIYLTGLSDEHIVILSQVGISFYDVYGNLVKRIHEKFPYYSIREKLYLDFHLNDSIYIINPQVSFFDFRANKPDNPSSLAKYYENYHAVMIYEDHESMDIGSLKVDFHEKSIFKKFQYHYPNYSTYLTYNNGNIYYMHNPDKIIFQYDLKSDSVMGVNVDIPNFEIIHKTDISKGMSASEDLNKARTLNSAISGIEYFDNHLFVQYYEGLGDNYIGSSIQEKIIKRKYYLLTYNLNTGKGVTRKLPDEVYTLQGISNGTLYFKPKKENENFELYYTIDCNSFL